MFGCTGDFAAPWRDLALIQCICVFFHPDPKRFARLADVSLLAVGACNEVHRTKHYSHLPYRTGIPCKTALCRVIIETVPNNSSLEVSRGMSTILTRSSNPANANTVRTWVLSASVVKGTEKETLFRPSWAKCIGAAGGPTKMKAWKLSMESLKQSNTFQTSNTQKTCRNKTSSCRGQTFDSLTLQWFCVFAAYSMFGGYYFVQR